MNIAALDGPNGLAVQSIHNLPDGLEIPLLSLVEQFFNDHTQTTATAA
jgi:hypothetical protein